MEFRQKVFGKSSHLKKMYHLCTRTNFMLCCLLLIDTIQQQSQRKKRVHSEH